MADHRITKLFSFPNPPETIIAFKGESFVTHVVGSDPANCLIYQRKVA